MNILWITNTIFPALSEAMGSKNAVSGGWMFALAAKVAASPNIQLAVATTYIGDKVLKYDIDGITYYLLPVKNKISYQKSLEPLWKRLSADFKPDIVHIHGTEFPHGLACIKACPLLKYLVSVQGLVSVISQYYYSGIHPWDIFKNITFRDVIRFNTIFNEKKRFKDRGEYEIEYIKRVAHFSGRTNWDYAHIKSINPSVNYYVCNRLLRDNFYSSRKWDISRKADQSIFCSQASYPIKGLHQVLKAVALLKNEFPDIKIRVAGSSVINRKTLKEKIRISGYGSYLRNLIKKYGLWENIHFTGTLSAEQMVAEYTNSHLFICPSSIENSPNSLGEAQFLGVPSIASYVGGTPDMIVDGDTGLLYRFEEVEMLAENIRRIFTDDDLARHLSSNAVSAAEKRHDRQVNKDIMLNIYSQLGIQ